MSSQAFKGLIQWQFEVLLLLSVTAEQITVIRSSTSSRKLLNEVKIEVKKISMLKRVQEQFPINEVDGRKTSKSELNLKERLLPHTLNQCSNST